MLALSHIRPDFPAARVQTQRTQWVPATTARPCRTVDHGNVVGFRITTNATAEAAGHPHQVGVFERFIRSGQRPPPNTEPARIVSHAEIRVQDNAIDAIVAAAQQVLVESAQPIAHGGQVTGTRRHLPNCPAGATFSQPSLRKSVGPLPAIWALM